MIYSYGNRRYSLGRPITTNWLILIIFIPHLIRDFLKIFELPESDWILPIIVTGWVVALIWLIVRVIRYYRPKHRPDLPSSIEITDTGVLRLFHGQEMYAEIPIDQIASLKDTTLDILPWNQLNASQLMLKTPVDGIDYIYVLPYLERYSEFILKLLDQSPTLRPPHKDPEWICASIHNMEPRFMMLVFFAVTVLVICITFTIQLKMKGDSYSTGLWFIYGINAILIWSVVMNAIESKKQISLITFYPNKMQIVSSSIWYSDIHPEDITKMEIIPAGKSPERYVIQTDKRSFYISSDNMRSYPELIQHIREFAGQMPNRESQ